MKRQPPADTRAAQLEAGWLRLTGQPPQAEVIARQLGYLDELIRWNSSYNLTAVRDPDVMIVRHLLDSLSILPFVEGPLLDVGTGAGLPGIPLALANPGLDVTLLDSAGKKVRFLSHVKRTLGVDNIHPVHARIERFVPEQPFRTITSRAFSSLADFARSCRHLAGEQTRLLAMKGRNPQDELVALPEDIRVLSVENLVVPGLQEDRHLVIMCLKP